MKKTQRRRKVRGESGQRQPTRAQVPTQEAEPQQQPDPQPTVPPYKTLPPADRAKILGLRSLGYSYREIAASTGRDKNTVMYFLNSEEAQQHLADHADSILQNFQAKARSMVPEALEGLEELIQARDKTAIIRLLYGSGALIQKTEQQVNLRQQSDTGKRSPEDRIYWGLHGHWPEEECRCNDRLKEGNGHVGRK